MDTDKTDNPIKEVLDELFALLETLESQNAAVLTLLKEQNIATDEKFAPHLERAESASSVKWRAARARMAYLLAPAPKKASNQIERPGAKEPQSNEAAPKETAPNDVAPKDAPAKGSEPTGTARNHPESRDAEPKEASQKTGQPRGAEPKTGASKGEERSAGVRSNADAGFRSGDDAAKRDSAGSPTKSLNKAGAQQDCVDAEQNANSKAASAGRGDENNPPRESKN